MDAPRPSRADRQYPSFPRSAWECAAWTLRVHHEPIASIFPPRSHAPRGRMDAPRGNACVRWIVSASGSADAPLNRDAPRPSRVDRQYLPPLVPTLRVGTRCMDAPRGNALHGRSASITSRSPVPLVPTLRVGMRCVDAPRPSRADRQYLMQLGGRQREDVLPQGIVFVSGVHDECMPNLQIA